MDDQEKEKVQVLEDIPVSASYFYKGMNLLTNYGMGTKGVVPRCEEQGINRLRGNLWLNRTRGPIRLNKGVSLEDSSDNDYVDNLFEEDLSARRHTSTPFQQMDRSHEY